MNELRLSIRHLQKSYTRPVLRDVNLELTNDSFVAVLGKSGSGKSTLLNILGLVEGYDSGEYMFNHTLIRPGVDYAKLRRENIGFIFQSYNLIPTLTCEENIRLPLLYSRSRRESRFKELVQQLDIAHLLSQRVATLSGGEKQRVAIARALMLDPCLILADEPTGNLDMINRDIIMELLRREHRNGRAILLITHDKSAAEEAETVLTLHNGKLEILNS